MTMDTTTAIAGHRQPILVVRVRVVYPCLYKFILIPHAPHPPPLQAVPVQALASPSSHLHSVKVYQQAQSHLLVRSPPNLVASCIIIRAWLVWVLHLGREVERARITQLIRISALMRVEIGLVAHREQQSGTGRSTPL